MRLSVILVIVVCALSPRYVGAQSLESSTVTLNHPTLAVGQTEKATVVARDLSGRPLPNASVSLVVRFSSRAVTYHLKNTDTAGRTTLSFRAPSGISSGKIPVLVTISNGFLRQTLAARFSLSAKAAATATGSRTPTPGPTATPTVPANGLAVSATALPPHVVSPNPVYVVVNARSHAVDQPGATVTLEESFKEGTVMATGTTDAYGVATIRIDTSKVRGDEVVKVVASVSWKGATSHSTTEFDIAAPQATVTPTPTLPAVGLAPTFAPAPASSPTSTPVLIAFAPVPNPSSTPTATPTDVPTATPFPTSTPYPTATDYPTPTPYPTYTPVPTSTPVLVPTSTPAPTYTATPTPNCPGSQTGCLQAMLNIINGTRAQNGLSPLSMDATQSIGTSTCAGSYGHSKAMAQSGSIWHTNASYPAASFGNNICVSTTSAAENVGQYSSGNELTDLQQIHNLMMSEAHDAATCSTQINHACNILTTSFTRVGIGIYFDGSRTWLTEDFLS